MTLVLRPADPGDAPEMARILWQFQHQHDWMPYLYSLDECLGYCAEMVARGWCTVAELYGRVGGFLALDGEEVYALYVAAPVQGRGAGRLLIEQAKSERDRLELRCVEPNTAARNFYRAQGFVEAGPAETTEDNLPGLTYVWPEEAI